MTMRELYATVFKEMGKPDWYIQKFLDDCELAATPEQLHWMRSEQVQSWPGETERDLIDKLKTWFTILDAISPDGKEAMVQMLGRERADARHRN